jgi:nucleotidyltransferase substrate binding protein (TIGR01987 family)
MLHRFEYTLELAWKTLQDYLNELGYNIKGPKSVIMQSFQDNIISDENIWLEILASRNLIVHSYNEGTADEIANKIINSYYFAIKELINNLLIESKKDFN